MISLCRDWEYTPNWTDEFGKGEGCFISVELPHTLKELPLHYAAKEDYEAVCGYRRKLFIPSEYKGKELFLQFDGAAHVAEVYINGHKVGEHFCGYTYFRIDISKAVCYGCTNLLSVKLDSREECNVPPFGFAIDYLTYGGLYREVWLDIRDRAHISDIYLTTPSVTEAVIKIEKTEPNAACRVQILDGEGNIKGHVITEKAEIHCRLENVLPWSVDSPVLYTCRVELLRNDVQIRDIQEVQFGFRTAEFKSDGFYLNGQKLFLRGLNRHQSYPYIGYAAPESLQREDARILKEELCCNAVRTSHYPQSRYFIEECDRLGLLVFTEIPGWQHIGDEEWIKQAIVNTHEMVLQYRNHPSVILWGVRINESQDNDEFYRQTNDVAHRLDPSRATSGVRYLEKSSLLEDVYAFNDFSHCGNNKGCKKKGNVTPDRSKSFLISECNGHMFPTKSFDTWEKRQEHALRHFRVQNDAAASGEHAGCFGWCMFDYATHPDFGSGDRLCYHGVMDSFRNAKLAGYFYASQGDETPILEIGSSMDIGDYPAGRMPGNYVFTNADEIRLYKNDVFVKAFRPQNSGGVPHPPIIIDDLIGELLHSQEGFEGTKEKLLHDCLVSASRNGIESMPAYDMAKMALCMARYGLRYEDGVALYGKYVANWGNKAVCWRFDAIRNGDVICSRVCSPGKRLRLLVSMSSWQLVEHQSYDMIAIRVHLTDENGNTASYAQLPVTFSLDGPAKLVGPATVTAEGGCCGSYIRSIGRSGEINVRIHTDQTEDISLTIQSVAQGGSENE